MAGVDGDGDGPDGGEGLGQRLLVPGGHVDVALVVGAHVAPLELAPVILTLVRVAL